MITRDYLITAPQGLHARPATTLIRITKTFKSAVSLKKDDKTVLLKSMLNILSMTIKNGETITVLIEGEDEEQAAAAVDIFFIELFKE